MGSARPLKPFRVRIEIVQDLPDDRLMDAYMEERTAVARVRKGHMTPALAWMKREFDNRLLRANFWMRDPNAPAIHFYYDTAPPELMDGHLLIPFFEESGDTVWVMDERHTTPDLIREYNERIGEVTPHSGIVRLDDVRLDLRDPWDLPYLLPRGERPEPQAEAENET